MKILHLYKSFYPETQGGVEQFIKNLIQNSAPNYQHHVITTAKQKNKTEDIYEGIHITRFPANLNIASCPLSWRLLRQFNQLAKEADILHYHFPWPFADLLHQFLKPNKPSLVTYHSDVIRQQFLKLTYEPLMKRFLKQVDLICPTSQNYLQTSSALKDLAPKSQVVPIGIAESNYLPVNQNKLEAWRARLGENFFLFIGVLRYYKGLKYLLDAVHQTDIPLVIAGQGPYSKALKKQKDRYNLDNVVFLGEVDNEDKSALLQLSRALVIPSHLRSEAFCISLLEGLMFGKPLICCDIGTGTSFVNQDQVTGYVVPPQDPQALRQALVKLQQNPQLVKQFGQAARQRYEDLFTIETFVKQYQHIYDRLIHKAV
jgi:rhamnosyl/mannosyltransferase